MKILASDFDETIYFPDNNELNEKNINSIKKFISKGNIFCIITGRNYTDLKQLLNENNIPYSYLICEDGAKIFNNMDYCLDTILLEEKERLVQIIKNKVNIHIYASRTHINIIHKTVNKENALKKLFNLEHLDYNKLHVIGDNDNDYEMIKAFNGVVIKNHHEKLNELNKEEYDTLSDYIEELMNN